MVRLVLLVFLFPLLALQLYNHREAACRVIDSYIESSPLLTFVAHSSFAHWIAPCLAPGFVKGPKQYLSSQSSRHHSPDPDQAQLGGADQEDCIPCSQLQDPYSRGKPSQKDMSAHAKRVELQGTISVTTDAEWEALLSKPGLTVVDVYAKWAGPCEPMQNIFKRLKLDFGDEVTFVMAQTDAIDVLSKFRDKSCPLFLFFFNGVLVKMVKGANAPMVEKVIKDQLELEEKRMPHIPLVLDDLPNALTISNMETESPISVTSQDALSPTSVVSPTTGPSEQTLAIIKPEAMAPGIVSSILDIIRRNRFDIVKKKKCWLTPEQVEELYREHEKAPYFQGVLTHMSTAPVLALVLAKDNAVQEWRKIMGPANSGRARDDAPSSIRALHGTDNRLNAVYGSETPEAAQNEIELLFGSASAVFEIPLTDRDITPTSGQPEKTLAIIKPDMIDGEKVDAIVERIVCRGYQVLKRENVHLSPDEAAELYSHQKEMPYFNDAVAFMASGPVVALVLKGDDVIRGWREMIGPTDPEIARREMPMSIRAVFGTDPVRNAVHGAESADGAVREIGQLFPNVLMRTESAIFGTRPSTGAGASRPDLAADAAAKTTEHSTSQNDITSRTERTCALIKPDAYAAGKKDEIVEKIKLAGFAIVAEKEVEMAREMAEEFYKEHHGKPFYDELVAWMSSTPIYAMVLENDTAITAWRELAGPTNSIKAKEIAPESIRALYGTDGSHNAVHGSDSPGSAEREIRIIFGDSVRPFPAVNLASKTHLATRPLVERTLALIKPDAFGSGKKDEIVNRIKEQGFAIVRESEVQWTEDKAKEFYKEHEGKGFYDQLVGWMSSAPIYAIVLEKEGAIAGWRELAGPTNSERAREMAPNSIRALYGKDGSHNAVHGSDSPQSAEREIRIVFGDTVSPFPSVQGAKPAVAASGSVSVLAHTGPETQDPIQPVNAQLNGDVRRLERTLALIKPDAHSLHKEAILTRVQEAGFIIVKESEIQFSPDMAKEFYKEHAGKGFYESLVEWMSSAPVYAMVLEREDAIQAWRDLAGPTNAEKAREIAPNSIRALFGTDGSKNAVHGSDSPSSAAREIHVIFGDAVSPYPSGRPTLERTLALLKPDVASTTHKDEIISRIRQQGFTILHEKEVLLSRQRAMEFYKEHDGKPFYNELVEWMSSAPIYAMVLEREGAVLKWRELAGATDPAKAKETAPNSIRALYGSSQTHNAVHGSDSLASSAREISILFPELGASPSEPEPSDSSATNQNAKQTIVTPRPPATTKPTASSPSRASSTTNITRKSTATLATRAASQKSLAGTNSKPGSRVGSTTALDASRKAAVSKPASRAASKPSSRVASKQDLAGDAKKTRASGLRSSTVAMDAEQDKGGEKDALAAAFEPAGHVTTHPGEGMDKVPVEGDAGPGIMEDPTNVTV
ncbi:uncharacterized protein SPPG_06597 [Spizellomyces punctatus DAOM BR117]|uniref:Nucleoside diphosphate kinase n=1 Tax=Spizellomyces punctatus (strain DAOM BR117) TaxID=645134 RepID=A0A0L0H9H3_SPIPD|nr:uncharacterized protein SPPG_06597 [Spizellomyces punctatus DAOM BR117]KNC98195.1 hypothetical protein SPPG_06597 [Spizellomyces punctatus DAOM BR117]|eukprot:XP_016606235.1 hypothetical protein SPPG_06597 [Spizellomyces punctatus DAOM BR117]